MKRWLINIAVAAVTVVIMALVFEAACRTVVDTGRQYDIEMWKYAVRLKRVASDPAIGHEHVPNTHAHLMGVDVTINSRGLRDREVAVPKPRDVTRILFLGDSIVFGWGVAEGKTIPAQLERDLIDGGFGPTEVINTGVGNYNSAMEVAYFLKDGIAYDPDIVVLGYYINDAEPTPTYPPVPWFARHAYSYPEITGAWDIFKRVVLGGPDWRAYYTGLYQDGAPGWIAAQDSIARLSAYCRDHHIRLLIANIPELHQLDDYPFAAINAKLATLAEKDEAAYLDLLPAVRGQDPATLWVTEPDAHPNAKADTLMARAVADYFLKHRPDHWPDEAPPP